MDFPPRRAPLAPAGGSVPKGRTIPSAMIEILADDRERNGGVIDRLRGHGEVSLVVERLPLGDYLIDEVLLIERKALPDSEAGRESSRPIPRPWHPVRGIGQAAAETIRWAVEETGPAYGDSDEVIFHL